MPPDPREKIPQEEIEMFQEFGPIVYFVSSDDILDIYHLLENRNNDVCRDRFSYNLVNFVLECLIDIFWFRMAGAGDDHGLLDIAFLVEFSNAFGGVVTIHNWHVAVHEDQAVCKTFTASFLDDLESKFSV